MYGELLARALAVLKSQGHRKLVSWEAKKKTGPSTARSDGPLARDLRVLIGWPFPLGFGLDGRLLLARRGRVYV